MICNQLEYRNFRAISGSASKSDGMSFFSGYQSCLLFPQNRPIGQFNGENGAMDRNNRWANPAHLALEHVPLEPLFSMKKSFVFLAMIGIMLLANGCLVLSFYPLYTADVLVKDNRIVGNWTTYNLGTDEDGKIKYEPDMQWEIVFPDSVMEDGVIKPNRYEYELLTRVIGDTTVAARYALRLVKLGKYHFLDFFLDDMGDVADGMALAHLMPVHSFAKVTIGKELRIEWFSESSLRKAIEQQRIRIRHEASEDRILLTASPEELQKFVVKYVEDKAAFEDNTGYILKK